jgi:hypothetical protein
MLGALLLPSVALAFCIALTSVAVRALRPGGEPWRLGRSLLFIVGGAVFGLLVSTAAHALPVCSEGQGVYWVNGNSAYSGASGAAACEVWRAANGLTDMDIADNEACRAYDAEFNPVTASVALGCEVGSSTPPSGGGTTVNCTGACTVTHEISFIHPLLDLTPSEGGLIASAVLAVWAVAWAFRMLIRFLSSSDGDPPSSTERE